MTTFDVTSWQYRRAITINHEKVPGENDMINFPLYFVCEDPAIGRSAQRSGADFVFTADDGQTKLSHEIRSWNPDTGHLVAYVKIPRLSPKHDTILYLHYGNPAAADQQDVEGLWSEYAMVRHLGHGRPPTTKRGGTIGQTEFLVLQMRVLEDLFGRDWFTTATPKREKHPAYRRWLFCKKIAARGTIRATFESAEANTEAIELAEMICDNASLIRCTVGDTANFTLGSIANYGDIGVQRRLRAVLPDHEQYYDVLAELNYAGWHLTKGHSIRIHEDNGWPDFQIQIPGLALPVMADSKRLKKGASSTSFKRVIARANRQVKSPGIECYGVVVINVTDLLPRPLPLSDARPAEVIQAEQEVARLLRNYYTSISIAVLVWDEITILTGDDDQGRGIGVYVTTKGIVVKHDRPLRVLPSQVIEALQPQSQVDFFVHREDREWV